MSKLSFTKLTSLEIAGHVAHIENNLIPDLKEAGKDFTAEDLENCITIIRRLYAQLDDISENTDADTYVMDSDDLNMAIEITKSQL